MEPVAEAAYIAALGRLRGIGSRSIPVITQAYPAPEALLAARPDDLESSLGPQLGRVLAPALGDDWERTWRQANVEMERHLARGIMPIPITAATYPLLLRSILDPPVLLYVLGALEAVTRWEAVAVVGTRDATNRGLAITQRVASRFAQAGFTIISGLAKGVDAAAHRAAIDAKGITIAVMATPLDKIYPAEHRPLAADILDSGGALVSELALGEPSSKVQFVQRDRIQSGLSLAVIPVETDVAGGTMHTVRYAEEQGRLLLCPTPPPETGAKQYAGIRMLIQTGRARGFQADDYLRLFQELRAHARRLVLEEPLPHRVSAPELPGMPARPTPVVPPDPADALERFVRGESWADRPESFDRVVAEVRERLFGQVGLPLEHPAPKPQVLRTTKVTRKRRSPKSKAVGAAT